MNFIIEDKNILLELKEKEKNNDSDSEYFISMTTKDFPIKKVELYELLVVNKREYTEKINIITLY